MLIGEGSLAMHCAEILLRREHELVSILTHDTRLAGWARQRQIPVHVPNGDFAELLGRHRFDYLFSVANLQILPTEALTLPERGAINFHDSELPRYAGVHATSWALMRGERRHGITWHSVSERVDAGEILESRSVEIEDGETAGSLNVKCFEAAAASFEELVDRLERHDTRPRPQDLARRSYFGRWRRPAAAALVDWSRPAKKISDLARALDFGHYPNPLAAPKLEAGASLAAFARVEILDSASGEPPGTLVAIDDEALTVATGTEDVRIGGLTALTGEPWPARELAARGSLEVGGRLPLLTRDERAEITRINRAVCRHEAFWVERLSGAEPLAHPGLLAGPTDGPVERLPVRGGDSCERYLERRGGGARLALLTAALAAAVNRHASAGRLDVAVPAALPPGAAEGAAASSPRAAETAARLFAGSVPMALEIGRAKTFDELVDRVEAGLEEVAARLTFARDVSLRYPELRGRRRGFRPALAIATGGGPAAEPSLPRGAALGLAIGEGVELLWRPAAAERGYARELADELGRILESAAATDLPLDGLPTATAAAIDPAAIGRVWAGLNATEADYPRDATVHSLFERQADRTPDRVAVVCGGETLTYRELDRRASRLAGALAARGVGPGSIVGIVLDRSLRLPVALLAALKAGAAYLPIDPAYPDERVALMVDDSGAELLLTERAVSGRRPARDVAVLFVDDEPGEGAEPAERPPSPAGADDLAYVIYTSGSTGRPKGVEIEHRSVVNFLTSMAREPGLGADDRVLAITTISFDISVLELFLPLTVGASVCLVGREVAADGVLLARALDESAVTLMQATPASWRLLLDAGWEGDPGLTALCGGEALPPQLAERLLPLCGALWNVYGPTETTIWSTLARVESAAPPISIGRPIANTRVYAVDDALEPVAPGRTGELVIGGDGLARGYHDRPELTAERFVESRSALIGAGRLYRTGDLARITADGSLECLGRIDHQVKIRGFRIEPGEIESALEAHPGVKTAVVVAREDSTGLKRLIAYLVPDRSPGPSIDGLRSHLAAALPAHMVPSAFVEMAELPLTGSGKVDRKALPEPTDVTHAPVGAPPATEVERAIAAAWEEALELRPIGTGDDFFQLGGHSLLLHQVRTRLQKSLGVELTMVELFRHPTVAGLAAHLERRGDSVCDDDERAVYARGNQHPIAVMARRFLIPRPLLTLYFYWRFKAKVSPRAEVEPSPHLELGRGATIGSFTKVKADKGPLVIGERSSFANGCFIGSGPAGLRIGKNLVCGPNVTIVPSNYVIDKKNVALADQGHTSKGIVIGDNVWIGAGSTILDGSELGDNTIVAAGSVVDRKFAGDCVVRGNPAEVVAER